MKVQIAISVHLARPVDVEWSITSSIVCSHNIAFDVQVARQRTMSKMRRS